jgi:RNase P subunit RPR2
MEPRIFHGKLTPNEVVRALMAQFNRGNLRATQYGQGQAMVVQIATRDRPASGGQTALTVQIQKVEDGVSVQIGEQGLWGVAASLGQTALSTLLNPWNLLGRLDDLAQDVENLQLSEKVWATVEDVARTAGASFELSERLRRMVCEYCNAANPVGEAVCVACGAPLGNVQPTTCKQCGFVFRPGEKFCANCGAALQVG